MKKLLKAFAVFAALAMLGSSFVACSSGGDDDDNGGSEQSQKYKCPCCGTEYDTEDEKNNCNKQEGCAGYVAITPSGLTVTDNPTSSVNEITGNYFPVNEATGVLADVSLVMKFDAAPTVDRTSALKISITKDGESAAYDEIGVKDETLPTLIDNGAEGTINVKDALVVVEGSSVLVKTHKALEASTKYSVKVPAGLITGKMAGADVSEITWSFTTGAAPTISGTEITVGSDKNFASIQGALDYVAGQSSGDYVIKVDAGNYYERLAYKGAANVRIEGPESTNFGDKAVVSFKNVEDWANTGARKRATFFVYGTCNMVLKNMTFVNTIKRSECATNSNQAETLSFDSSGTLAAYNCSFKSHQDTLYIGKAGTRAWFYKCYISGDTDFIWGYASAALYEECEIRCRGDEKDSAIIFASRADQSKDYNKGFVLLNSKVFGDLAENNAGGKTLKVYYGRNSGADTTATVVGNTFSGQKVQDELWQSKPNLEVYDIAGDMAVGYKDGFNTYNNAEISGAKRLASCGALSERVRNREYNGRYVILNRGYNQDTKKYVTSATPWDISALETEFEATDDASKENVFIEPVYVKNFVGGSGDITFTKSSETATLSAEGDALESFDASTGVLKTKAGVTGTVTVKVTNGTHTDTATVTVIPVKVNPTAVVIDDISAIVQGQHTTVKTRVQPADATNKGIKLSVPADSAIQIYDVKENKLVNELALEANDEGDVVFDLYAKKTGPVTLTATSTDEDCASVTITKDVTVGDTARVWECYMAGAFVNTDIQSGTYGVWEGAIFDSKEFGTAGGKAKGKMGMKADSKERTQTYNMAIYIPCDTDADIVFDMYKGHKKDDGTSELNHTDRGIALKENVLTFDYDSHTYTYKYDVESMGKAAPAAASLGENKSASKEALPTTGKFAKIVILPNDCYILSITVTPKPDAYQGEVKAVTVTMDSTQVELDLNGTKTATRTATLGGANASEATVSYESDATGVATVDASGVVTAKGIGYATIKAKNNVTDNTASYKVFVKDTAVANSYAVDLKNVAGASSGAAEDFGTFKSTGGKFHGTTYGWIFGANGALTIKVNGSSKITVSNSYNGTAANLTVSASAGAVDKTSFALAEGDYKNSSNDIVINYTGSESAEITLTTDVKDVYISKFEVEAVGGPEVYAEAKTYDFRVADDYTTYSSYTLAANGMKMTGGSRHGATYGWDMKVGNTLELKVSGSCTVTFLGSQHSGLGMKCESSAGGTIDPAQRDTCKVTNDCVDTYAFTYTGEATTLTFTTIAAGGNDDYVPTVTLTYN